MSWIRIAPYIAIAAATAAAFFIADGRGYDRGHDSAMLQCQTVSLPAARQDEQKKCAIDKAITKETNDELQSNLDTVKRRLDAALMQKARCIIPVSAASSKANVAGADREHAGQDGAGGAGISSAWLYGYAAQCESIRQTALSCAKFVDKVWESRGDR